MARRKYDSLVIRGRGQLRALSSPQRVRILERLIASAPLSIREVAGALNRPAAALYHHFSQLEGAGLIVQAGVRGEGRTAERIYAPAARALHAAPPRNNAERDELARAGETQVRYALRRFSRAVRAGDAPMQGPERTTAVRHLTLRVSPEQLGALNRDIDALTARWAQAAAADDGIQLSLLLVLAPENIDR
jgi:DNA-binding transcriptional ArsR family regulator